MLNTFLKLVGLSSGKSLQSAADAKSAKPTKQGITLDRPKEDLGAQHGVAGSARRHEVKAAVKKSSPTKKPVASKAKTLAKTKASPPAAKKAPAKPVVKLVTKQAAKKAVAKPLVKAAAAKQPLAKKPVLVKPAPGKTSPSKAAIAKPVAKKIPAKASIKAIAKAPVKLAVKPPSKPAPKPLAKPIGKPVTKPPARAVPASQASAKPASKKVSVSVKAPLTSSHPVAKPAVKVTVKPAAKVIAKPVAPPAAKAPTKAPAKAPAQAAVKMPASKAAPTKVAPVKSVVAQPAAQSAAVPAKADPVPTPVAAVPAKKSKSGFMSPGNIAPKPMEVSTAAKTNFTMSSPVLVPPPQLVVKKDPKLVNNWKTTTAAHLTDAEAIAMPDTEYMSALQLAFFRLKLVQLKKEILSNAGETTEHLREDTSVVPDPADRATIEEEHALELRTRDRERKLLKKIEQSIARIDSDDYGFCDETGEAIGVARLIARPTANLSLEAQQRRELKQKMFGD